MEAFTLAFPNIFLESLVWSFSLLIILWIPHLISIFFMCDT